jgi:hypothetical protein
MWNVYPTDEYIEWFSELDDKALEAIKKAKMKSCFIKT